MTSIRTLAFIGLAGTALVAGTATAANIVVRSAGPSAKTYAPGKALPDSASIVLRPGDMVTILGPNSARTLRGPGTFTAASANRTQLAMAAGRRSRFGAMRTGDVVKNPSIWDVDVTQSGKMCVNDPAKLAMWRPTADSEATLNIRTKDGKAVPVAWAAGKTTAAWPANLPVTEGAEYQLEWPNSADKSAVSFVLVPGAPADLVGAAKVLLDKGCQNQLDLLVDNASAKSTD
jgi:hypothetical protein